MKSDSKNVALVTGANRGIGLAVTRQLARLGFTVILGARDAVKGQEAAQLNGLEGADVIPRQLDVTDRSSIEATRLWVEERL
jgi:NAD(P)-dependent dehydrogenase (short-subunit alcohol dehydrogenase family)